MPTLESVLADVDLFRGMTPEHLLAISGSATNVQYDAGDFLGRTGDPADKFWLVRQGRIALEIFVPGRGAVTIATMSEGDVVGFSWLLPPYELRFDVRALTAARALEFDGRSLRGKCTTDPGLGYELLSRFSRIMANRIEAMSLQLMDVYGDHPTEHD